MSENLADEFIQACLRDDVMTIRRLLDRGADVDQRIAPPYDLSNSTVLHRAAMNGFMNTCSILLARDAYIEPHDDNNWTPLQCACAAGKCGVARLLIEYGASINAEAYLNTEYTPMNLACKSGAGDLIQLMINSGAAVNATQVENAKYDPDAFEFDDDEDYLEPEVAKPPLYTAYAHNNAAAVRLLLDNGAKCDLMQRIHVACLLGSQQALSGFLRNGDKINARDCDGKTPLHVAVSAGHYDVVRQCLQYKAKVYKVDLKGRTPLHYAVEQGNVDVIALLLKVNVPVCCSADNYGATPLRIACQQNNLKVVDMLLRFLDSTCDSFADPASLFATNDIGIISRLLEFGYEVNTKDGDNSNLLHKACEKGDKALVDLLLQYKTKLNGRQLPQGYTPLHIACRKGHTDIALTLIQYGAQVAAFDLEGRFTALHMACEVGDFEIVKELLKKKCVNAYDGSKQELPEMPLDIATQKGHYKIVELLLKSSPDMDDDLFRTGIEHTLLVACENIEPKLVRLFLKYGSHVDNLDHGPRPPLVVVIHAYLIRLENRTKYNCVNDVISILIMLISHGCRLGYLYTDMELLTELHYCECVFAKRNDVTRFLLLTGIDIVVNMSDNFLAAILRHSDFETLRMLAASGFVFNEMQLEEVCFNLDSGDMLLSAARDAIFQLPSLQNLCRAKIRRVIRTTLLTEDELRRKRHLSSRIGDYFRKVTGVKRKRLPLHGIDRQIDVLPLPARIKDFLCFHLYDVT